MSEQDQRHGESKIKPTKLQHWSLHLVLAAVSLMCMSRRVMIGAKRLQLLAVTWLWDRATVGDDRES